LDQETYGKTRLQYLRNRNLIKELKKQEPVLLITSKMGINQQDQMQLAEDMEQLQEVLKISLNWLTSLVRNQLKT